MSAAKLPPETRPFVGTRAFEADLEMQAKIAPDIAGLNAALADNPGRFAAWAMMEAEAEAQYDAIQGKIADLKSDLEELEARLVAEYAESGTVSVVKAKVAIDERRLALVRELRATQAAARDAKATWKKIGVGRRTLEQKRDSLLALASNWRQEMQTQLQVRAAQFKPGGR